MQIFNVLALDPSLKSTGWCSSLREFGAFKQKRNCSIGEMLFNHHEEIRTKLIDNKIDYIFREGYATGFHNSGTTRLMELGGNILKLAWEYQIPVIDIAPRSVKQLFTGNGKAQKIEVMASVNEMFDLDVFNDDMADAIAIWCISQCFLNIVHNDEKLTIQNKVIDVKDQIRGMVEDGLWWLREKD